LDDDPSHILLVEIALTKAVGGLKDLIKEKKKHGFHGVDAKLLVTISSYRR
jgi:Crinkler effector protein N-terminal domain